jgi:hypothetical protein
VSSDVVSPGDWLVSRIWFLLSTGLVAIGWWHKSASLCKVVRAVVVFTRQQLCCPSAATLFGQLLPQQGGAIQFRMLPSVPQDQLWDPSLALLWEVSLLPHPCSQLL